MSSISRHHERSKGMNGALLSNFFFSFNSDDFQTKGTCLSLIFNLYQMKRNLFLPNGQVWYIALFHCSWSHRFNCRNRCCVYFCTFEQHWMFNSWAPQATVLSVASAIRCYRAHQGCWVPWPRLRGQEFGTQRKSIRKYLQKRILGLKNKKVTLWDVEIYLSATVKRQMVVRKVRCSIDYL